MTTFTLLCWRIAMAVPSYKAYILCVNGILQAYVADDLYSSVRWA